MPAWDNVTLPRAPEAPSSLVSRSEARKLGLKHYSTGEPCKHGHFSKRFVINQRCIQCSTDGAIKNGSHRTASYKWYVKNKEKSHEMSRKWGRENRDKVRAASQKWRDANREEYRAKKQRWVDENRERRNLLARKRYAKDSYRALIKVKARQARRRRASGSYTEVDISNIRKLQKGKCAICKVTLEKGFHIDHIVPLIKGGSNWPSNLQITCAFCNVSKGSLEPIAYMRSIGRLL